MIGLFAPEPALVLLATRRYPGTEPLLAVEFLHSDRRAAGLGALDERKRGPGYSKQVFAFKFRALLNGHICYRWGVSLPPRMVAPPFDWQSTVLDLRNGRASATLTSTLIPARNESWAINFDARSSEDQQGRTMMACALRDARRKVRAGEVEVEA